MSTPAEKLSSIYSECRLPGWNGEGADGISESNLESAKLFLASIPADLPPPDLAPEPDGSLEFEWYVARGRTLSVSVNSDPKLCAWAFLNDPNPQQFGSWEGGPMPDYLSERIRTLFKP